MKKLLDGYDFVNYFNGLFALVFIVSLFVSAYVSYIFPFHDKYFYWLVWAFVIMITFGDFKFWMGIFKVEYKNSLILSSSVLLGTIAGMILAGR